MSTKDNQPLAVATAPHPAEHADAALQLIVEGLLHFQHEVFPQQKDLFKKLATAQRPRAMFIACADSRIVPELITQSAPGDLFVTRNVGNVVPPYGQMNGGVSTAIEYASLVLGVQHIIVCGHSDCGAMRGVLNPDTLHAMPTVKAWLRHAEVAKTMVHENCGCADESEHAPPDGRKRDRATATPAHSPQRCVAHGQRSIVHPRLDLRHRNRPD